MYIAPYIKEVISTLQNINFRQKIFENQKKIWLLILAPDLKLSLKFNEKKESGHFTRILFKKGSHICKLHLNFIYFATKIDLVIFQQQNNRYSTQFE